MTGGSAGGGSSSFSIELDDKTSASANSAASALAKLGQQIEKDQKSLRAMSAAMARLKGGTSTDVAAFKALRAQMAAHKESIAQAQAAYVNLGGNLEEIGGKGGGLEEIFKQVRGAGGPVGSLAGRFAALANPVSAVIAIATVGIGVLIAFTAAIVGAAMALGRMALASADARRSEQLHLQGLVTLRNVYGIARGSADDLMRAIDRVSDSSALARTEVTSMAEGLYRAGLRGANLEDALEGLSIAQSVQGDRGAARFRAMAVSIARTGGSVRRLTDDYRTRLGGIATRQAMGLDRQMERLRESVGRIFGDVRIEGFLTGMHSVLNLFSQSTITGRALHQIATTLLSPFFDQVGEGAPTVVHFLRGMVIEAQRITIAYLTVRNAWRRAFGGPVAAEADRVTSSTNAGRFALLGLAVAIAPIVIGLGLVGLAAYGAWQNFQQLAATWTALTAAAQSFSTGLEKLAHTTVGGLIDGIINGITGSYSRIRTAMTGLAGVATQSLTQALGIHSPSRVFAQLGAQVPRGFAIGVERETGTATSSVHAMSEAIASTPSGGGGASASAPNVAGRAVTIGDIHVHLRSGGEEEGRAAGRGIIEELLEFFEGSANETGATA